MQAFGEFIASLKGEINARNRDPIFGVFVITWATSNWDKLATLVWGSKPTDVRIQEMVSSLSFGNVATDYRLLIVPVIASVFFLFLFPWISLLVRILQEKAIKSQHTHSVDLDLSKTNEQKRLRKAILRANPEKEFLAEEVKLDLQKEREKNERRNKIKDYIQLKLDAARAEADEKTSQAETARVELEREKRKQETEAVRFDAQSALHKETLASSRFPAVYQLMEGLSKNLHADNITLSLECLSRTIATVFGYPDSKAMMDDRDFTRESIAKVKYLYIDMAHIVKEFDKIAEDQNSLDEHITGEFLFEHLQIALEGYEFKLLSGDALAEDINERVNIDGFEILQSDELSGPMADTDTQFDEIELAHDHFEFSTSFIVKLIGTASGSHRRDSGVPGQDLDVTVVATCVPKLGKFGLSDYNLKISGSPRLLR
ncbi:MAG: hypothetical protein ABJ251_17455 [Paracoccaceae bacterium]